MEERSTAGQGRSHLELMLPGGTDLLPRELVWIYLVAPVVAAQLLVDNLLSKPLEVALRDVALVYIPSAAVSVVLHTLYRTLMPVLVRRIQSPVGRGALHFAVTTVVAFLVGLAVLPFHNQLCQTRPTPLSFGMTCVVISWVIIFPALLVQRLRNKALNIERMAQAERQAALRAQLEALQARTNPHFFFNSINAVASLIPEDPVLAERTLERLADLFRYALESSKTRLVALGREVDMVRDYLAIQQVRYGSRLKVEVELDERAAQEQVPPLLLQPLVENAILHGMANRQRVSVSVRVRHEEGRITLCVQDDGPGPGASSHQGSQTSVRELRERVRLVYGELALFTLEPAPGGGCLARLALPAGGLA